MVTSRLVVDAEVDLILGGFASSLARVEEGDEGCSARGRFCQLGNDVVHFFLGLGWCLIDKRDNTENNW